MMKRYGVVGLTILFVLTGTFAFSQGPKRERMERGQDRAMPLRFMQRALELSDAQVDEIRRLQDENRAAARELRAEQRELRRQLRDQVNSDAPSEQQIGALVLAMNELKGKMHENQEAFAESVKAVLTPEQLADFEEMKQLRNRRHRREHRRPEGN